MERTQAVLLSEEQRYDREYSFYEEERKRLTEEIREMHEKHRIEICKYISAGNCDIVSQLINDKLHGNEQYFFSSWNITDEKMLDVLIFHGSIQIQIDEFHNIVPQLQVGSSIYEKFINYCKTQIDKFYF